MSDAEEQFSERLADDLERVLGAGIATLEIRVEGDGPVQIEVACLVEGSIREIRVEAADLDEAYRKIVRTAAQIRLSGAWWQMVGPS